MCFVCFVCFFDDAVLYGSGVSKWACASDQFANNDSGMDTGRASSPRDFAVILNCNHARDDTQALKIVPTDYQMVLDRGTKRSMIRQNRGSARSLLTNMSTHTGEPSHTRQRTIPSPPFLRSSALYTICTIEACGVIGQ